MGWMSGRTNMTTARALTMVWFFGFFLIAVGGSFVCFLDNPFVYGLYINSYTKPCPSYLIFQEKCGWDPSFPEFSVCWWAQRFESVVNKTAEQSQWNKGSSGALNRFCKVVTWHCMYFNVHYRYLLVKILKAHTTPTAIFINTVMLATV